MRGYETTLPDYDVIEAFLMNCSILKLFLMWMTIGIFIDFIIYCAMPNSMRRITERVYYARILTKAIFEARHKYWKVVYVVLYFTVVIWWPLVVWNICRYGQRSKND